MTKPEMIDELLDAVRKKANRMTSKQLKVLRENHQWLYTRKKSTNK